MKIDDGSWSVESSGTWGMPRPDAFGFNGMVASAHPLAASIGVDVLRRGGNAVDAALAVAAAEGVLLPMSCGIGGDAFVIVHDARRGETVAYNGSGVAGARATRERYAEQGLTRMPLEGVHAVGVPGAVSVYEAVWKSHATWSWADLWAPAIRLAEDGVAITDTVSKHIAGRAEVLARYQHSADQFLPGGSAPASGVRWSAPSLAGSLRAVAEGGAETFYRGPLAERILAFLTSQDGPFVADDFARQQAVVYEPLRTDYRDVTVCQTAPPSQGFLMLEQLNLLEGFDLASLDPFGPDRLHLLIEAKKLAFADRNRHAGDPDFVDWPLQRLISKEHAAARRREIDPRRARTPNGVLAGERGGDTSYFAVADGEGTCVSFIHSLSASFGSGVVAGDTGITLNNRVGRGFSLDPRHPNVLTPGRRTMHTLNAFMAFRGSRPWLVGGTPGGDQQTQWNVQLLTNLVDHGLSLQAAVEAPRWYSFPGTDPANLGRPMSVRAESRVPDATRRELEARGHVVETLGPWSGGGAVQLIEVDQSIGVLRGATDPRAGGLALGL